MHPEVHRFAKAFAPKNPVALTLTMKQCDAGEYLDEIKAEANFKHFMNRVNRHVFGNAFRRYGRRLGVLPIMERSASGRLHYHAVLENPYSDIQALHAVVANCWSKTRWGYHEIDVREQYNDGWVDYILKARSLEGFDAINAFRAS